MSYFFRKLVVITASNKTINFQVFNSCLVALEKLEEFKNQNFPNSIPFEKAYLMRLN